MTTYTTITTEQFDYLAETAAKTIKSLGDRLERKFPTPQISCAMVTTIAVMVALWETKRSEFLSLEETVEEFNVVMAEIEEPFRLSLAS